MDASFPNDFVLLDQMPSINPREHICISPSGKYLAYSIGIIADTKIIVKDMVSQTILFEKTGKYRLYFSPQEDKFCIHNLYDDLRGWTLSFYSLTSNPIQLIKSETWTATPNISPESSSENPVTYESPINLLKSNFLFLVSSQQKASCPDQYEVKFWVLDWEQISIHEIGAISDGIGGRRGEGCNPVIMNPQESIVSILGYDGYIIRFFHFHLGSPITFFSELNFSISHPEQDTQLIFTSWNFSGTTVVIADHQMLYFLDGSRLQVEKELDLDDFLIRNILWLPDGNSLLLQLEDNRTISWYLLNYPSLSMKKMRKITYTLMYYSDDHHYLIGVDRTTKMGKVFQARSE